MNNLLINISDMLETELKNVAKIQPTPQNIRNMIEKKIPEMKRDFGFLHLKPYHVEKQEEKENQQ